MTILTETDFAKSKATLDKMIKHTQMLADKASQAYHECCKPDLLDQRDQFTMVMAELRAAESAFLKARSIAGGIEIPEVIARSGGT